MKWLKQSLWLSAWGVWVWLGVGLYHELPRDFGPPLYKLALDPNEKVKGFLHETSTIITDESPSNPAMPIFRLRNAATGVVEREIQADRPNSSNWSFDVTLRHGLAVGHLRMPIGNSDQAKFAKLRKGMASEVRVLNLASGEQRVFDNVGSLTGFHATRPWGLFCRNVDDGERAVVLDLLTGRRILDAKIPDNGFPYYQPPYFLGGDHFVVSTRSRAGLVLEIRSIASGELVRTFSVVFGNYPAGSSAGHIAWYSHDARDSYGLVVVRISNDEESLVHPFPPGAWGLPRTAPRFSSDGRNVLSFNTGALLDVATHKVLWKGFGNDWEPAGYQKATKTLEPDHFEVEEKWQIKLGGWSKAVTTFAMRSMKDGSLFFRSWDKAPRHMSDDYFLVESANGFFAYRLPLPVNWPLLFLCQTLLASPLVLIWSLFRWRRRRAARRRPAETSS